MAQVEAKDFHPMHGHVDDGVVVIFSDWSKATVRPDMGGWSLVADDGTYLCRNEGAYGLTHAVVQADLQRTA